MADDSKATPKTPARKKAVAQPPIKDGPGSAGPAAKPLPMTTEETGKTAGSTGTATQAIKDGAGKLAKQATDKARDYVAEGKTRAGGALDEVSRLMGDAATTVDEKLGPQYGQYARTAAEGIAGFSESLKGKEIEDLMADAQNFVRKSPAVAIGVAAALGFVLARLVKAGFDTADQLADGDDTPAKPSKPTDA